MPDDSATPHPADGLIDTIRGIFNGETFLKGIRDAWDQHMGSAPKPATPAADDPWHDSMVRTAQESMKNAAQNNLTPTAAAKIRAKTKEKMGN